MKVITLITVFLLLMVSNVNGQQSRQVAVTFDDLPTAEQKLDVKTQRELNQRLLQHIKKYQIPAIGFVNENKVNRNNELAARTELLQLWLDAGLELGNHGYSHPYFFKTALADFQQDVIKGEEITAQLLAKKGQKIRYFRHPFLNTGPDLKTKEAFEQFLKQRGYRVAPVTIDNMEWIFAKVYGEAKAQGDQEKMRKVVDNYLVYMEDVFKFYEQLSSDLLGRELPQILLLHANQLNADHFDKLAEMMKRRGYQFVNLDQALTDKAYQHNDSYTGSVGISWLQRWAVTEGKKFRPEPQLPEYMKPFDNANASGSDFKTQKKD